ncbi:MAG: oligosaccharide flippase family protein [Proteobacteria bacterium]|nr:oligosaccharide flippase family protein [Pseudomonadota bacterium]
MADTPSRFDGKFLTDTAWNYAAFAIMAATGVILNFFIAMHFGIETLGVFNQIYAVYIVTAQLAVMGLHDSVQKHNAEYPDLPERLEVLSAAALWLALGSGLLTAILIFALSGPIGRLADSEAVGRGIAMAAPGLLFFALNKVLMGILNGRRRMKAFAAGQAFRVSVILASCLGIAALGLPGYMLGASFTIAEVALLPGLLWVLRPPLAGFGGGAEFRHWLANHFRFGTKALVNGFLAESYIRVDIIMLGVFVSDHAVGIYSFAALFIEGLYQVPSVVRTIANPVLVRLFAASEKGPIVGFCRRTAGLSAAIYVAAAGAVVVIFPYLEPFFPDQLVPQSTPVLWVLVSGLLVYAAFIPLDHALLQAGSPGRQSLLMSANVAANVALNLALIPFFGIMGAAIATAVAFAVSTLNLNLAAGRWLGMRGGLLNLAWR